MLGYRQDVRPYLVDSDVYVAPSTKPDPFPRAVLEAMSLGLAIIGSRSGGIPEALTPNATEAGLLFPPGDERALAMALTSLRRSAALRRRLGEAATRAVQQHFTLDSYCARIVAEFEEILSPVRGSTTEV